MKWLAMAVVLGLGLAFMGGSSMIAADKEKVDKKDEKKDDKTPTIKEVMKKLHGEGGLSGLIKVALNPKDKEPKWDEINERAKEVTPLAKALAKNTPPKGDAESWETFTKKYAEAAEKLEKASADKDAKVAKEALSVVTNCKGCHEAHRIKK